MKKQRFIVDGMIYPGLHILSGDPKIGKSWMMLDMCLTAANGEDFLGRKTERGQVVYMALEDTFVRLQSRLYELTDEPSENLFFTLLANSTDRDSSGGKILYTQNAVPADPETPAKAVADLHEAECVKLPKEENAVPAVPVEQMRGDALIAMAAEMMRRNLAKQGITVPAFNPDL